jgi:hypothetical protein
MAALDSERYLGALEWFLYFTKLKKGLQIIICCPFQFK